MLQELFQDSGPALTCCRRLGGGREGGSGGLTPSPPDPGPVLDDVGPEPDQGPSRPQARDLYLTSTVAPLGTGSAPDGSATDGGTLRLSARAPRARRWPGPEALGTTKPTFAQPRPGGSRNHKAHICTAAPRTSRAVVAARAIQTVTVPCAVQESGSFLSLSLQ